MQTEILKIYVDTYKLFFEIDDLVLLLPKTRRGSIGNKMMDLASDIMYYIFAANEAYNTPNVRTAAQRRILNAAHTLKSYVRFCREKKFWSIAQAESIIRYLDTISSQAYGWLRATN